MFAGLSAAAWELCKAVQRKKVVRISVTSFILGTAVSAVSLSFVFLGVEQ